VISVRSIEGKGTTITIEFPKDNRRSVVPGENGHPKTSPEGQLNRYLTVKNDDSEISS
jgi:hypothetical protein